VSPGGSQAKTLHRNAVTFFNSKVTQFRIPKIMKSFNIRKLVARQNENERKFISSEPIKGKAKACKTYTAEQFVLPFLFSHNTSVQQRPNPVQWRSFTLHLLKE